MQTAMIRTVRPTGLSKLARCVLDNGRHTSFVGTFILDARKLDVFDQENLDESAFENSSVKLRSRRLMHPDLGAI
jgi:hypothetical protein